MGDLVGKVVVVTGAGKGAGRRVAETCAARGASVAVNDLTPVNLDETVARITAARGKVKSYVEDIAKQMPVQALLSAVLDDFGRIDALVNCAEVEPQKKVLEMDDWDWQRTLDVNLTGAFLLTRSAGRIMREKGGGVIVHKGTRAKEAALSDQSDSSECHAAYFASKAGLAALIKIAAAEFAAFGVHVYLEDSIDRILEVCGE